MADVAQKIINANDVHNGTAVVGCDMLGNVEKLVSRARVNDITPTTIEAKYTDRFDDINYYSN